MTTRDERSSLSLRSGDRRATTDGEGGGRLERAHEEGRGEGRHLHHSQASGVVVWFVGLPSSGKSTLAREVAAKLEGAVLLDGDEVRACLHPSLGYTAEERDAFYETLSQLAALIARQGHVVLVPATANLRFFRQRARALAPRFLEVFVDTPLEECVRRDAKGLYAAQTAALPGTGVEFEAPASPDVIVKPGVDGCSAVLRALSV